MAAAGVVAVTTILPALAQAQFTANANALLEPANVEQLRALALSQGDRHSRGAVSLPPRPQFAAVAMNALPPRFCSEAERNAFHDSSYKPVVDIASRNNAAAVDHMKLLKRLQAEASARGDSYSATAIAQEAFAYEPVARQIYQERMALNPVFVRLMAVPIGPCTGAVSR